MGMTHTTLETQPFPPPSSATPPAPPPAPAPGYHSTSSSQLTVRTPAPASLSPILEEAAGFSSPGYEYEAAVTLPLQHPYSDGESLVTYPPRPFLHCPRFLLLRRRSGRAAGGAPPVLLQGPALGVLHRARGGHLHWGRGRPGAQPRTGPSTGHQCSVH